MPGKSVSKSNGRVRYNGGVARKRAARVNGFRVGRSAAGLGLFATELIKRGKFIIEYWGRLVSSKDADHLSTRYLFDLSTRYTIDGSVRENTARYINHSCKPNAVARSAKSRICIYALKNIHPGDEITYNYGRDYFERFLEPVGCKCVACAKPKRKGQRKTARKSTPSGASKSRR